MSGSSVEDYGALANATDISDLTSDEVNADILRKLKNNDPNFDQLHVRELRVFGIRWKHEYVLEDARSMGVLGYYLGRCTHVTQLEITLPIDYDMRTIEPFLSGLARNRSIQKVWIKDSHVPRDFFLMLAPFIKVNPNLSEFIVQSCVLDVEQYRSLSLALREGKSLRHFVIGEFVEGGRYDHEESIIENIEALKMHPQLELIALYGFTMGRNVCAALSDLLQHSAVGVRNLILRNDDIDDAGIEALVDGLAHCRGLRELDLMENPSITAKGCRALASLLEDPNTALLGLSLRGNIYGENTAMFANALAHNKSLQRLYFNSTEGITPMGWWAAFSTVLCDTSSVNSTFLSNHTLRYLTGPGGTGDLPDAIASLLNLNREENKKVVAYRKILLHHDDLDMQPLFEWDLKVLPHVVEWLERAAAYGIESEARTTSRRLSATYQFIRGMPELAVEGILGPNKKSTQIGGRSKSGKRVHRAPPLPTMLLLAMLTFLSSRINVNAFATLLPSTRPTTVGALHLARKYVVIGGNIPGIDPNKEEDTYNMSKKERRRREREKGAADFKKGKYKTKKQKLTSNSNVDYDKLEERVTRERAPLPREARDAVGQKKLSPKAARIQRQRTAGGVVDSTREAALLPPGEQGVQIRVAKRSNKTVTMVQGLTVPMSERKALLKEMKAALGGGGTLAAGVLELQGSHAERVLEMLKAKGYAGAKVVGGGGK